MKTLLNVRKITFVSIRQVERENVLWISYNEVQLRRFWRPYNNLVGRT